MASFLGFWGFSLFFPANPALTAETLTLRLGLVEKQLNIQELENYVETAKLPPNLQPYQKILTPAVRQSLEKHLYIDGKIAQQFLEDVFSGQEGEKLLSQLNKAIPDSNPSRIKSTLAFVLKTNEKVNIFSFLKAYPHKNLTLDLLALASIARQISQNNVKNTLISSLLDRSLVPSNSVKLSQDFFPDQRGDYLVFQKSKSFYDSIRNRAINTDVYYASNSRGPLVIMSHGFAADRRFLRYLASHLASFGFTVVSVEHPGSNINALINASQSWQIDNLLPASEFIERPKDISFILNELTALNKDNNSIFFDKFNTKKVTIIGHSFGGYTALALAGARLYPSHTRQVCQSLNPLERSPADWLQCAVTKLPYKQMSFRDYRIDRAIVLNPIVGSLFSSDLAAITIPVLMLSSTEDGITPIIEHQLQPFERLSGEKYLIVAKGATHMSATDIIYLNSSMGQSTLVREIMDEEANPMRAMIKGVSLAFIEQSTSFANWYQPYLSSNYIESFNSQAINFRFTQKLPTSVTALANFLTVNQNSMPADTFQPKSSWLEQSWTTINSLFTPSNFRTESLGSVFGELLDYTERTFEPWG
jgi:predicted dienelactone hydrolase